MTPAERRKLFEERKERAKVMRPYSKDWDEAKAQRRAWSLARAKKSSAKSNEKKRLKRLELR